MCMYQIERWAYWIMFFTLFHKVVMLSKLL